MDDDRVTPCVRSARRDPGFRRRVSFDGHRQQEIISTDETVEDGSFYEEVMPFLKNIDNILLRFNEPTLFLSAPRLSLAEV